MRSLAKQAEATFWDGSHFLDIQDVSPSPSVLHRLRPADMKPFAASQVSAREIAIEDDQFADLQTL